MQWVFDTKLNGKKTEDCKVRHYKFHNYKLFYKASLQLCLHDHNYRLLYVCYDFTYEELGSAVCVVAVTSRQSQSVFREDVPVAS